MNGLSQCRAGFPDKAITVACTAGRHALYPAIGPSCLQPARTTNLKRTVRHRPRGMGAIPYKRTGYRSRERGDLPSDHQAQRSALVLGPAPAHLEPSAALGDGIDISAHAHFIFSHPTIMSPSTQCPICWEDYSPQTSPGGSPPVASPRHTLPCGHVFHVSSASRLPYSAYISLIAPLRQEMAGRTRCMPIMPAEGRGIRDPGGDARARWPHWCAIEGVGGHGNCSGRGVCRAARFQEFKERGALSATILL